ncbi:NYN domain-containing protein [Pseudonocardia acaciae]|uniref:NYN domain-containing protein n=1 Tax=Pseudonocardia acaciae TaxID=551276 RepID=UPI00055A934E|nr:NYN domain-containing protein [Pseudonocardia acaciae]
MGDQGWAALPEPVRVRLAEIASVAVGELPPSDVPSALRRLARFTPGKRARLGARALLGELRESSAFRSAVVAWWTEHRAGDEPGTDRVTAAAVAVLTGAEDATELVASVAERVDVGALRAERDAALARVDKLTAELERLRAELAEARSGARQVVPEMERELEKLRRRIREQGMRVRAAEDRTRAAESELAELRRTSAEELAVAVSERDRARERANAERARAARAGEQASGARAAAREARKADEARLELLLDTLAGAVAGIRGELALGGGGRGGPRPADLVRGARPLRPEAARVSDPSGLDRLLALPSVHLIVDGYNVSKTGYPELTLFDQRTRLVGALGALAARTGAEITVVFDGAAVAGGPSRQPRGVRVLFSDPGVTADDVIRELVGSEPFGRPVLVVSSDRAVAESVHRGGAHPLASSVLLDLLSRG